VPQKNSAGILVYRIREGEAEVLLVHPGGPFWSKKDEGAWFVVKGEVEEQEDPLEAAKREFHEEIGEPVPGHDFMDLGTVRQKSGKLVHAWAVEGTLDVSNIRSNTFTLEWPPKSGKHQEFPEVDRARFFSLAQASRWMHAAEREFLPRLAGVLAARGVVIG
jgi:predicted NUDIX family NTP pyrophosphohydrolase